MTPNPTHSSIARRARPLLLAGALAATALSSSAQTRFAVVGHVRGDATGQDLGYLDELVSEIGATQPDFVVLCGDLVWGDVNGAANGTPTDVDAIRADWQRLDAAFSALGVPIHRVPGNHDINDRATRELWFERYGELPRAVRHADLLLLLVSSAWIPADDDPRKHPPAFIRGVQLDAAQRAFVATELEADDYAHAFVFQHHMLWWQPSAPWWRDVHPLLAAGRTRAVFAGDYGPLKFSHTERDGVHYLQTSVENEVGLEMLRLREESRLLSAQLDNFVLVTVSGPEAADVRYEVRTVAALSSDKFSPRRYRDVHEHDKWSLGWRLKRKLGTSEQLLHGLGLVAGGAFLAGVLVASLLGRLRSRR